MATSMVPMMDISLQQGCKAALDEAGVEIILGAAFASVTAGDSSTIENPDVIVELKDGRRFQCDCLFAACGRTPNSAGLGLEKLESKGLKIGRRKDIEIDGNCCTGCPNIYAVGDVAGGMLATQGQAQAVRAVRTVFGSGKVRQAEDSIWKPCGVWMIPELAWVGMTEDMAKKAGLEYATVTVNYDQTMRGCISGEEGFLKLIYHKVKGTIYGVHMQGENSCDIINYGAEAVNDEHTIFDTLKFVFPAVTYHELYNIAAIEALSRIRQKGAKDLGASNLWGRISSAIRRVAEKNNPLNLPLDFERLVMKTFQAFDDDGNGHLEADELRHAMSTLGVDLSDQEVTAMIVEANGEGQPDDVIDYEDFVAVLMNNSGS
eukprot:TRINITY_DN38675_c0_g1_i2.p1 TRINITY_DN38675_c0_g1~~TRINITY_DN38675_c0_g1_i2.p1  ORF type:complete len:394 (+),score=87.64 TRINITY_DN38675_c0_g1_i2:59-1183(+)